MQEANQTLKPNREHEFLGWVTVTCPCCGVKDRYERDFAEERDSSQMCQDCEGADEDDACNAAEVLYLFRYAQM